MRHQECDSCVVEGCGWCMTNATTRSGTCYPGDKSGPFLKASCLNTKSEGKVINIINSHHPVMASSRRMSSSTPPTLSHPNSHRHRRIDYNNRHRCLFMDQKNDRRRKLYDNKLKTKQTNRKPGSFKIIIKN